MQDKKQHLELDMEQQSWRTSLLILNQSVVPCPVLNVASCPAYRLLRRQVKWSAISSLFKIFPQFIVIHTVKCFSIINEAEVDIFLEFPYSFYDPVDVGNLISGSSARSPACTFASSWLTYC